MTAQEIINIGSKKVRSDSHLMRLYIDAFKEQFGKIPSCAGCTFSTDFLKLKRAVERKDFTFAKTIIPMKNSFQLKSKKGKILSYQTHGRTIRRYDTNLTEEFVVGFLTHGTEAEINERKKLFSKLPDGLIEDKPIEKVPVKETKEPIQEPAQDEIIEPEKEDGDENPEYKTHTWNMSEASIEPTKKKRGPKN